MDREEGKRMGVGSCSRRLSSRRFGTHTPITFDMLDDSLWKT